jgi:hypothetical protein
MTSPQASLQAHRIARSYARSTPARNPLEMGRQRQTLHPRRNTKLLSKRKQQPRSHLKDSRPQKENGAIYHPGHIKGLTPLTQPSWAKSWSRKETHSQRLRHRRVHKTASSAADLALAKISHIVCMVLSRYIGRRSVDNLEAPPLFAVLRCLSFQKVGLTSRHWLSSHSALHHRRARLPMPP